MSKLLDTIIIEDEYLLLEDILSIVNWEQLGFNILDTAINGEQGAEKILQLKPRIIITDIRMPVMNGLEMIRTVLPKLPQLKAVILTAYSDFDYAKEALKYGVTDYILKSEISESMITEQFSGIYKDILRSDEILLSSVKNKMVSLLDQALSEDYDSSQNPEIFEDYRPLLRIYQEELQDFTERMLRERYRQIFGDTEEAASEESLPDVPAEDFPEWFFAERDVLHRKWEISYGKGYSPAVRQTIQYIDLHYCNPDLSINEVAGAVHFSVSRLCIIFKKETGQTINEYLTDRRIEEAKKLLRKGDKVYEVTMKVGYRSSQYFSRIFYQRTRRTPTEFR